MEVIRALGVRHAQKGKKEEAEREKERVQKTPFYRIESFLSTPDIYSREFRRIRKTIDFPNDHKAIPFRKFAFSRGRARAVSPLLSLFFFSSIFFLPRGFRLSSRVFK